MNPDAWAVPLPDKCVPGPAHGVFGQDRISQTVYDAAGQPLETWDAVGSALARREAAWSYNLNGQKTSLTDARGFRAENSGTRYLIDVVKELDEVFIPPQIARQWGVVGCGTIVWYVDGADFATVECAVEGDNPQGIETRLVDIGVDALRSRR